MKRKSYNSNSKTLSLLTGLSLATSALGDQLMTDNFADRFIATGTTARFSRDTTSSSAAPEYLEPNQGGVNQKSVWGGWQAPHNGTVSIDTSNSAFNTVLAVYVGDSLETLLPVAHNDSADGNVAWSKVTFPTKAGAKYSFAVVGQRTAEYGQCYVNVAFTQASQPGAEVGTDLFADRPTLSDGLWAIGVCDSRLASHEFQETNFTGEGKSSVWWRWVAATNGTATVNTFGSDFPTVMGVYVGTNLLTLSEIALGTTSNTFRVQANTEYQIRVDAEFVNGAGNVILNVTNAPDFDPPGIAGYDSFEKRGILSGSNAGGVANNTFFSLDSFESVPSVAHHTAWWKWTAPADGPVAISTEGSDFDTFLAVYSGSSLTGLQLVAASNDVPNVTWSRVQFNAQRDVDYQIMVDGARVAEHGNIALSVNQAVPLPDTLAIYPAVEVIMPGKAGVTYRLQASPDLISWEKVADFLGTNAPISYLDSTRGTNKKFYRYLTLP